MTTVNERLKALQITLPEAPPVVAGYVAAFVPFVRTGNLIYLSGRLVSLQRNRGFNKYLESSTALERAMTPATRIAGRLGRISPVLARFDVVIRVVVRGPVIAPKQAHCGALVVEPTTGPRYDGDYAVTVGDSAERSTRLHLDAKPGELTRLRAISA